MIACRVVLEQAVVEIADKYVTIEFNTRRDMDRSDEAAATRQLNLVPVGLFADMERVEILRGNPEFRASTTGPTVRIHVLGQFTSAHEEVLKRHRVQRWRQEQPNDNTLGGSARRARRALTQALARLTK